MTPCPYHDHIEVTTDGGQMTRPACRAGRAVTERAVTIYPVDALPYLGMTERAAAELPPRAPGCRPAEVAHAPQIDSPRASERVLIIPGIPLDRQRVPLRARVPAFERYYDCS